MATLVKTIKSRSTDDIIYPVTKADAVYFNDENNLVSVQGKINTIQGLLGSSSISNVGSSITGIIGNEALTTTAQTLAGAINEHQTVISDFKQIETGIVMVTRNAGANTANVTFSKPFTSAPIVFVSYSTGEPTRFVPYVNGITATSAVVGLFNSGAAVSTSVTIRWMAVEV